jgi:hypothetical protein
MFKTCSFVFSLILKHIALPSGVEIGKNNEEA